MAHRFGAAVGQRLRVGLAPLKWGTSNVTGLATRLTLPLIWVGHFPDAADNPLMAQPLLDGVLPMAPGWPTTECCRWPPDDPWLLQSGVAIGFKLALPLSNGVLPMVQGWPLAIRRRWPLDGPELFHNSDTDSIETANDQMLLMTL